MAENFPEYVARDDEVWRLWRGRHYRSLTPPRDAVASYDDLIRDGYTDLWDGSYFVY